MSIYRTNNPLEFFQVEGIVIDERAPAPNIQGVASNRAILVGQFESGPETLEKIGSTKAFFELYGNNNSYMGNVALLNKRFGALSIIRAVAAAAAKAARTFTATGPVNIITFTAKYKGAHGNSFSVKIEAGSSSGKKYTVTDNRAKPIFDEEVYDNVVITAITSETFSASKMVDVTVVATSSEPDNIVATALTGGSDGTIADSDYEAAIAKAKQENAGNVLFLDVYNATRNGYLELHAADTQDKMVIYAGAEGDSISTTESAVALLRDADGRGIYAENWIQTKVDGVDTYTSPASWVASIFSQTPAHISLAYAGNVQFTVGAIRLKNTYSRDDYIRLKDAGVASFENDPDLGIKLKSAVVTQIANSSKQTILRRRMADYLTNSVAKFLKLYQDDVNRRSKHTDIKGAMLSFIGEQERLGILPSDLEVAPSKAKLVDVTSLNDNTSIGQGKFFIKYKQRIFSSMRFIVLVAEIGETVEVTESEE